MADLTTTAAFKTYARISGSADDALIASLITAVSNLIEQWLSRTIIQATYNESYDGNGSDRIYLHNAPVSSVTSVSVDGVAIPQSTLSTQYGWVLTRRTIRLRGDTFPKGAANVQIVYVAGYATVPPGIAQACHETVKIRYDETQRKSVSSQAIGGETTTYIVDDLPKSAELILIQFKEVTPS